MNEVIVSICIPTYKNITSFERCLTSILSQTYNNYEIIITDDTPSDVVNDFVVTYDFKGKPYKYIKNKVRLGSPANWNEAIKYASGKYIKVLHHDDWFTYSHSLQIFVNTLENKPEASIGFVSSKNINTENGNTINTNSPSINIISKIENTPAFLISGNFIGSPSATIFRKQNIQYFDEKLIWLVDVEAYLNILRIHNRLLSFDKNDAISIGVSNSQLTRECENNIQINIYEFFYILHKYKDDILGNKEILNSIVRLIYSFNLENIQEVRRYYQGPLPKCLLFIFFIKKYFHKKIACKIFNSRMIFRTLFKQNIY